MFEKIKSFFTKPPEYINWEYTYGKNLNIAQMNEYGRKGWELVSVIPSDKTEPGLELHYYFKRELDDRHLEDMVEGLNTLINSFR